MGLALWVWDGLGEVSGEIDGRSGPGWLGWLGLWLWLFLGLDWFSFFPWPCAHIQSLARAEISGLGSHVVFLFLAAGCA